jgi:hypothetical protein
MRSALHVFDFIDQRHQHTLCVHATIHQRP